MFSRSKVLYMYVYDIVHVQVLKKLLKISNFTKHYMCFLEKETPKWIHRVYCAE